MEKILNIEDGIFSINNDNKQYNGYKIITNLQTIIIGISIGGSISYEDYGVEIGNENLNEFIGSEIKYIEISKYPIETKKYDVYAEFSLYNKIFVNFETSKGLLQFACYSFKDNSVYHLAIVKSNQLNYDEWL